MKQLNYAFWVVLMCLLFSACSPYNYAPLPTENPMFTEKGELHLQASANIRFYQGQVAYSPYKHFGVIYGFSSVINQTAGSGFAQGISIQRYKRFNPDKDIFYSVGLGFGHGYLNNTKEKTRNGEFYIGEFLDRAISKYIMYSGSFGIYWNGRSERTQLGFHVDLIQTNYSLMRYSRTALDTNATYRGYPFEADNQGKRIYKPIGSFVFSMKLTSPNGLFYLKESVGFRLSDQSVSLYDKHPNPLYPNINVSYKVPSVILNFQFGMNIDQLYRKRQ